jgi:hypothetical protein
LVERKCIQYFLQVIQAFIDHAHLQPWWGVSRSLIEAKPGGIYTPAWEIAESGINYSKAWPVALELLKKHLQA